MSDQKDPNKVKAALARADSLTPEQKRAIAVKGAIARWGQKPVWASHKGNFKNEFGFDVDCFVLDDEQKTAVISQRGMGAALGLGDKGKDLPRFLKGQKVSPYVGGEVAQKLANPLIFQWAPPGVKGLTPKVYGYDVTIMIDLCKAIIAADDAGKLLPRQKNIAKQAHVIMSASAKAGITGLVYALAGYDQTKQEIIAAFKRFVRQEARDYEKEFPSQLYEEWHRLYQLPKPQRGRPWKLKDLTLQHVYIPLAKSDGKILALLRKAQRASESDRATMLHQFLSEVGVKALRTHLGRLLGMAETSSDLATYEGHVAAKFGVASQLNLFNV